MKAAVYLPLEDKIQWWVEMLQGLLPGWQVVAMDQASEPESIDVAVVWRPRTGDLARFANLKAIVSIGAGIDHVLADENLPVGVPIIRTVGDDLTQRMREYVALHVLRHHRDMPRQLQAQAARLNIVAPAAGLVLERNVEPGQVVGGGSSVLFRLAKGGEMEMQAQVAEGDLATLRAGNSAVITPIGTDARIAGRVWQVSPVVDPQTRQGIARIAIPYDQAIRPGGFASATITSGSGSAPLLPESAVQSDPKGSFVYIVNGKNQVERRNVTVGQVSDDGVAITDGITGAEKIVTSAGAFLTPGQKVKPEMAKGR